jgi:hypothetical protein
MIPSTVGFASPRLLRNLDVKNQGNPILKFHHSDTRLSRVAAGRCNVAPEVRLVQRGDHGEARLASSRHCSIRSLRF